MAHQLLLNLVSALIIISPITLSNAHSHRLHKRFVSVSTNLPAGWSYKGCQTEATNGRALTGANYADGNAMTEEKCINFCNSKNYIYAGTEYSGECFCGNSLAAGSKPADEPDCNMACSGDNTEACGGPNRLTLFSNGGTPPPDPVHNPGPPGWAWQGCYAEGNGGRTLTTGVGTTGGGGSLTVALCTSACKSASYNYAGVEYSGECYCGNSYSNGGGPATDGIAGCNMLCNGNTTEYCGGPNRLDVYKFGGTTPTSSGAATSAAATSAAATTTPAGTTGLPTGWSYKGCYVDNVDGRILITQNPDSQTLTVESCVNACISSGYKVAGIEYSTQCFCGNAIINGGALASDDSQCSNNCPGNANEKCGAGNRMSIYSNGTLVTQGKPAAQATGLPGSWKYQGCISEGNAGRVFKYQIIFKDTNSAETCLNLCAKFKYGAGGMEYGEECYCGDATDLDAAGSVTKPTTDCNVPCPGNSQYLCGGGNRISYYTWTGKSLSNWAVGAGAQKGKYQFLIGGVVIPLITTQGTNGKITFVEKHGTGAPNSTGAYEFDISQSNNFAGAWREMHLKTDVFCSAGLTLPDKVGRQINIGGWSGESTYGIRLYWPDGSPGVASTNDWQENVAELKLQTGRWYPSAMVMTNGSILVVGGEEGSNGAPVPNLEVLPKPSGGGLVTLDFLQRTDPYNLYPFLAVLPSGKIFIAYFNEARILDPVTFDTYLTLPSVPGSVSSTQGGRTYPLEGTAVLLPQRAPYSAPLGILICGGSTPGAALAIDNCVSSTPEGADNSWTLERMPSQRVMPCMTALPDGTYLILNGAKQGTAGFGLATNPNFNAVLYDPTKEVDSRFTILDTTNIARLYHSEAILLQDGRVLVSGSDPQDGVHPEEYRVEVFIPPYLLTGLQQPSFNLQNKDWSYGQLIAFTVNAPNGGPIQVSLMGAESSTHGNSMGQRTIFPTVTCGGAACIVTAPPNANICPPGWYQMFVLDAGTPSFSKYVRIGGDPASLGNWPPFNDFIKPGV